MTSEEEKMLKLVETALKELKWCSYCEDWHNIRGDFERQCPANGAHVVV